MQVVQEVLDCVVDARSTTKQIFTFMKLLLITLLTRVVMSFKAAIENIINEIAWIWGILSNLCFVAAIISTHWMWPTNEFRLRFLHCYLLVVHFFSVVFIKVVVLVCFILLLGIVAHILHGQILISVVQLGHLLFSFEMPIELNQLAS